MKRYFKIILSFCMIFAILVSTVPFVQAGKAASSSAKEIHIKTLEDFLNFESRCRIDSYSKKLTVHLDSDIDLSKSNFSGIPIFFGIFLGNGHTIKGLNLKADGTEQGLFRFLKSSAEVKNLKVEGKISSEGKTIAIGGIAGHNSGKIENCNFEGEIVGTDFVGGIAGINAVTGVIDKSSMTGTVSAKHFAGGIAGDNKGVVRSCFNYAGVNITEQQNVVNISDITVNSITSSEAINTVTDIGGISGCNSGVIKKCKNYANIGYPHMGYNIGGICGSQIGYISECENYAKIFGRKEVGGIVGQMEPSSKIEYSKDSLQLLQTQLRDIYFRSHNISNTADNNNEYVKNKFISLGKEAEDAIEALTKLIPENEEGLKDPDRQQAALNVLSSSANSMMEAMGDIHSSSKGSAITTSNDFKTIIKQIDNMASTLSNPSKELGMSFFDVSDKDTKKDLTGKIEKSLNYGSVSADVNTGGIVGAIAWENDLDPEDDWNISGEMSLNFESEVRAVVLNCENFAEISSKKRGAGGIAGYMSFGLIKDCINTGIMNSPGAEYVGGIAGESSGYIRNNSAKCEILAKAYAGGIAGSAITVTDCRSMTNIKDAKEKTGAVLGIKGNKLLNKKGEVKRNYYLITKTDFGGIDGISYSGVAQPLNPKTFFGLPKLNDIFKKTRITFVTDYGIYKITYVQTGKALDKLDIPDVPEEYGKSGEWENLNKTDLNHIYYDLTFHAVYTSFNTTVQSKLVRKDGKPILLALSSFSNMENFSIKKLLSLPKVKKYQSVVEGWEIPKFSDEKTQLRYAFPKSCEPDSIKLLIRNGEGKWKESEFKVNKSYIIFTVDDSADAFCVVSNIENLNLIIALACAIFVLAVLEIVLVVFITKKKSRKKLKIKNPFKRNK